MNDLTPNSTYEVYIIGGSFHPGFPDLMQDGNIVILETDTLEAPVCNFFQKLISFRQCYSEGKSALDYVCLVKFYFLCNFDN